MIVTIVGAGRMARGIGTRALVGGHRVRLIDRTSQRAHDLAAELRAAVPGGAAEQSDAVGVEDAEVVVLAVPYPEGVDVVADYGSALSDSVLVDICNPVDMSTLDSLTVPPGMSAAEQIATEAVPGAPVVKAFNTTFAGTLTAGQVASQRLDVLVAGDDEDAKHTVSDLAASGGLRPLDVGPLRRARELEAFQLLHMAAQDRLGLEWSSAVKILP